MGHNNISFVFFTYNEEKRLPHVLRNFSKYGEVIIMDGGSTDKTEDIAREHGVSFYLRPKSQKAQSETPENFNFLKSKLKTDWVYWGYVDNLAPKTLIEKMIEISHQNKIKYVQIPLYTYLWGNTDFFAIKGYSPMLFHKDFVDFDNNYIHGMGRFVGKKDEILKLPNNKENALIHFSAYTISKFVSGHLKYAETESLEKFQRGERFSLVKTIAAMLRYIWIFRLSFRRIKFGFIVATSYAFSRFLTYVRLYEIENNISIDLVEDSYNRKKEEMLGQL